MEKREEILKLIELYNEKKYDTKTFCDVFITLYFFENSANRVFEGKEKKH